MGMIMRSGRVSLLSGQIWRYWFGFPLLRGCAPGRPLGRMGRAREEASWAETGNLAQYTLGK
jgi:hypothetical protein